MGSNDQQFPYYLDSSTNDQNTQNRYTSYQPRSNQYGQHSIQGSSLTSTQNRNYQQPEYSDGQAQQPFNAQNYYKNAPDAGQQAAETLSCRGASTSNYPSTTVTSYHQGEAVNLHNTSYNQASNGRPLSTSVVQNRSPSYPTQHSYSPSQTLQGRPNSTVSVRPNMATARSPVTESTQHPRSNTGIHFSRAHISSAQQRSASPAQIQASHQLQRLADQRSQEPAQTISSEETYVDPFAVYDPWPEYQRKLEVMRAAKEADDRAAAAHKAEERRKAEEEAMRHEEAATIRAREEKEQSRAAEQKQRNKADCSGQRVEVKEKSPAYKRKRKSRNATFISTGAITAASVEGMDISQLTALANAAPEGSDAEAQIRSIMAIVKQMNDKHPDLVAKIWEEERQQHLSKKSSPIVAQTLGQEVSASSLSKTRKKAPNKSAITGNVSQVAARGPSNETNAQAKAAPVASPSTNAPVTALAPTPSLDRASTKVMNATNGIIWAPEKKDQIAATVVGWLKSLPGNNGRSITAPEIVGMLDKNPTHLELCKMIERLGFTVDRAAFPKILLASVPDVNRSSTSPAIPRPPITGPLRTPAPPPVSKLSTPILNTHSINRPPLHQPPVGTPTQMNISQPTMYESPSFDARGQPIAVAQQLPTTKQPTTIIERRPLENKKSASADAKYDQPSETPGPISKVDAARKRTFADLVDLTALSDDDGLPAKKPYYGPPPASQPGQAYSTSIDYLKGFHTVVDPYLQQSVDKWTLANNQGSSIDRLAITASTNRLNTMELAKPIDRKNALRRSRYDIRTLARDVLLATGKHPDLLSLNGHLESLRSVFTNSVNFNSDLATLRWDLIDPGDPIPAALENVVIDDKDSVIDDDADDESEEEERQFTARPVQSQILSARQDGFRENSQTVEAATPFLDSLQRGKHTPSRPRGRPRGRPTGYMRVATGGAQTPIGNHPASAPHSASPASGASGTGYSQFHRELRPDGTKPRGRPVGWRKDIHMKGAGAQSSSNQAAPGPSRVAPPSLPPELKFMVYKCGWTGCNAQLHNLETLRRHIKKKHGVPDKSGKFTCLWGTCGRILQTIDEGGEITQSSQRFNFPDTAELMQHVEGRHVRPIAWELGDGPPGGFSDSNPTDSEAYLSDQHGRRVTPTIPAAATGSNHVATPRPGQRGRPPKKSDEDRAKESQAELAKRKREIGLGVDREGATFANEKRRAGFVDDEDESEIFVDAMEE